MCGRADVFSYVLRDESYPLKEIGNTQCVYWHPQPSLQWNPPALSEPEIAQLQLCSQ